ncbi:type VI secretion system-associated protein TagF [Massilia cavernae]|uniref:Type VI secretion system-associated protein TagF n=1 Tax=Massilia cavernae TaxID=2320864 RepID=A0A418XH48_9BURK|nr:type VI secretion system-associated protein TagF [Massilia cavernae]RJG11793.1 type VI secretion system-associated protein TagF [Massilia cavernae]
MIRAPASGRIGYFGKVPTRSDFIKAAQDIPVMDMLDNWMTQVMSLLPSDARWKINYDALAPVSFAFVGPRRKHAIAGHLVASSDQSGRRYPFLMMRAIEVADPAMFVSRCPMVLDPLWGRMEVLARDLLDAQEPAPQLQAIPETMVALDEQSGNALGAFLATGTVSSLGALLCRADVRHLILALGLLLQPVMQSGAADLHKSLVLPLPLNAGARHAVAAFWLELIAPFLGRADFELALFITCIEHKPVLVVGFSGAAAQTLHAIIDPLAAREQQVSFADTDWVDEQVGIDVDVRALASYLDQPQLPLKLARELFLQTFIGVTT